MRPKPQKITFLIFNLEHGGAEKICALLGNELLKRNNEIELWVGNYYTTSLTKHLDKRIKVINLNKKHVRHCFFPLFKLIRSHKPKILLVFHVELAILATLIKTLLFSKTKIVVRSINTISQNYSDTKFFSREHLALRMIKFTLFRAHKTIAQSTGMRDDIINNFNIDSHKIKTIFNPAHIWTNGSSGAIKEVKRKNEFLFVGRICPQKGLTNLIQAFAIAHRKYSDMHLTLVGEGEDEEKIKTLVKEMGLGKSVSFEGRQINVLPYFKRATATVLTSVFEGFPNVLVESISVGTPVVAFNCPSGPIDIIEPEINGILVKYLDIEAFANAMLSIVKEIITFDTAAVINSAQKFSVDSFVAHYTQVLSE